MAVVSLRFHGSVISLRFYLDLLVASSVWLCRLPSSHSGLCSCGARQRHEFISAQPPQSPQFFLSCTYYCWSPYNFPSMLSEVIFLPWSCFFSLSVSSRNPLVPSTFSHIDDEIGFVTSFFCPYMGSQGYLVTQLC